MAQIIPEAKESQEKIHSHEPTAAQAPLGSIPGKGGEPSPPKGLEAKLHLFIKNTDPDQIALWECRLDSSVMASLDEWCMVKKKKKNQKNQNNVLPPLSPASTRSRVKADVGIPPKGAGRKNSNQLLQEETKRNLVDGSQRTIKDFSRSKK